MPLKRKEKMVGWVFIIPAVAMLALTSFYPMIQAIILSFFKSNGVISEFIGFDNYTKILQDRIFLQAMKNNFFYLIFQVPVMLLLALILAVMLNDKNLKFKGLFRTAIFLPCATSLASYAIIFSTLFQVDGYVNTMLVKLNLVAEPIRFFNDPLMAKIIIIVAIIWRWTGYNMVFYLAGLQNIDSAIYEAAKIDGANAFKSFFLITIPLLQPLIVLTAIMSTNGTLQLYEESVNLTMGGPANQTITMSHYIYNTSFVNSPQLGYASAMSVIILVLVSTLALLQMKVGDKRD
ncbi:MAG: sugar ABC transporter permease [Eubacteriales bacterium]